MKSILEEFARGNISPDTATFKKDSVYGRALKALCDKEAKLLSMLNDESKEAFEQYNEAHMEVDFISGNGKFIYGYRLGVLMTMEVFIGNADALYRERSNE